MRFRFVVANDAGSARVRGHQVARALGAPSGTRCVGDERVGMTIFVKHPPSDTQILSARKKSDFLVYDPIDHYDFNSMRDLPLDGVIACSDPHAIRLEKVFPSVYIAVIPHHHCVMEGVDCPAPAESSRVGYIGDVANLGICKKKLRRAFPDVIISNGTKRIGEIGIGIAFRPPGIGRAYKSGIKLANYWAMGIATVCSPDSSYCEMIGGNENCALVADNETDALSKLKRLQDDEELRKTIATNGGALAHRYNLSSIVKRYELFLNKLSAKA